MSLRKYIVSDTGWKRKERKVKRKSEKVMSSKRRRRGVAVRPKKRNVLKCLMMTLTRAVSAELCGRPSCCRKTQEAFYLKFSRPLLWKWKVQTSVNAG